MKCGLQSEYASWFISLAKRAAAHDARYPPERLPEVAEDQSAELLWPVEEGFDGEDETMERQYRRLMEAD
jgi:hypothetical protein